MFNHGRVRLALVEPLKDPWRSSTVRDCPYLLWLGTALFLLALASIGDGAVGWRDAVDAASRQIFRAIFPSREDVKGARTDAETLKCSKLKKEKVGLSVLLTRCSFITKVRREGENASRVGEIHASKGSRVRDEVRISELVLAAPRP